jgi:lipopolysaccharide biosynthesis protein
MVQPSCNLNPQGVCAIFERVEDLILGWIMRFLARVIALFTPRNDGVESRWLKRPEVPDAAEVCLFVAYAPIGIMSDHARHHAEAWAKASFRTIVVLNVGDLSQAQVALDHYPFAEGVMIRQNRGYDFGAWASALKQTPNIERASLIALANDSVFGPLNTFDQMLSRVRITDADVIGATESRQLGRRHLQSFLLFFKPRALTDRTFWRFWDNVRAGGRTLAVSLYELNLARVLERGGLRTQALFPSPGCRNPTLTRWRELIMDGFPYVKVALLRDNHWDADLTGWRGVLSAKGYDPSGLHY